jgi:hypothetical protein
LSSPPPTGISALGNLANHFLLPSSKLFKIILMIISLVFTQFNLRSQCLDGDWTTNDATCESSADGSICCDTLYSLIPGAGLPPYTCVISPNAGSYNSATSCFINLPAGTYNVTTTSSDGCSVTFYSLVVGLTYQPITATFAYSLATCGSSNGGICANVIGGSGSYSYSWTGPPLYNTVLSTSNCISNQSAGTYQLIIDDNNSPCTAAYSRTIQNSILNLSGVVLNTTCVAPNCNGAIDHFMVWSRRVHKQYGGSFWTLSRQLRGDSHRCQ